MQTVHRTYRLTPLPKFCLAAPVRGQGFPALAGCGWCPGGDVVPLDTGLRRYDGGVYDGGVREFRGMGCRAILRAMIPFSVIIPAYNAARTLPALLESLEAQEFRDFETIVVDDCSTDETAAIAKREGVAYYCLPENSGPATARNFGVTVSQGAWLVFVDSDMELKHDTMARIAETLERTGADALVASYTHTPRNPGFVPRYKALWEYISIDCGVPLNEEGVARIATWAPRPGVVSRKAYDGVGGFNTRFRGADLEDMEFGYRLAEAGYVIVLAPHVRSWHHYPASWQKEMGDFTRRVALWSGMFAGRKKLESTGEGSPSRALADVFGFLTAPLAVAGFLFPPFWLAMVFAFGLFVTLNRAFVILAWREEGTWFALKAVLFRLVHSLVVGFAIPYGLVFCRPEKGLASQ